VVAAEGLQYYARAKDSTKKKNTVAKYYTRILLEHKTEAHSKLSNKNRGSIRYSLLEEKRGEELTNYKGVKGGTYRVEGSLRESLSKPCGGRRVMSH